MARDSEGALAVSDRLTFENVILVEQGSVQGAVTDSSGSPIFNATLTLRRVDGYLVYRSSTNVDGRYNFNRVLSGSYVLEASAKDFATNSTSIEVVRNQTTTANLTLYRLPIIHGYVKTKLNTPISDALITVFNIQGRAGTNHTDEDGFYRVVVSKPGTFSIRASAYGYQPNSSIITVHFESVMHMNFTLEENGIVEGRVKDLVSGLPIANATVYLGKQTYLGTRNSTNQYGNFSFFDVLPGDYVVRATAKGYLSNSSSIAVVEGATTYVELGLMPTANITGTVRDSDTGTPIGGAKVALINELGWVLVLYVTDANGTYHFERVRPGNYTLKAYAYGYNSTTMSVEVKPYETSKVDFYLVLNKIILNLNIPSSTYSRGETMQFTITATNPLGESIAENITSVQLVLMGPSNEKISVIMNIVDNSFTGSHVVPPDASIGTWAVLAKVTDVHGNVAEDIKFVGMKEAFYILFDTDRKSYVSSENATFFAIIARYTNLSRFLDEQTVSVNVHIHDESNTTLAQVPMTTVNNVFIGTYPLNTFDIGNYTAFLTVDDGQGNKMSRRTFFKVVYDFSVSVSTNKLFYNRTETVTISGSATYETGDSAANISVKIRLEVKGYVRTFSTSTDNNGHFEYIFVPTGFDSGNYTLESSIVADDIERRANSTFVIIGLILNPHRLNVEMSMNSANNLSISIGNIGETLVTGINISITPLFDEVKATIVVPPASLLTPSQWTSFTVTIASSINTPETVQFNLMASTDQGTFEYGIINVNLYPATPAALVNPPVIDVSLTPDSYLIHQINITNIGYGTMDNVHVTGPSLPWIFVTLTDLGTIDPKESKLFDIIITPAPDIPVGVYEDQVTILSDNHQSVNIYLIITITSIEQGSLLFHVFDELGNQIPDAQVMLQYQELYMETLSGTTSTTGQLLFDDLSTGRYSYLVSKEEHDSISGVTTVYPGKSTVIDILLPSKIMDVSFTVEPITLDEDYYVVTLNMTFQAEIPPPILLPIPPILQFEADRANVFDNGHSATGEVSIFNTGLIDVSNVEINIEYATSDPQYHLSILDLEENIPPIDVIKAKDSARIPIDLNIDPGALITELPSGLIGSIKISGTFIYFDPGSDIPHTAVTLEVEVRVFIHDAGDRRLCVNPWPIYGIKQESVISFMSGLTPEKLPDVTITNCANIEAVSLCRRTYGGGITIFLGLDLEDVILMCLGLLPDPLEIGGFVVSGLITKSEDVSGEEDQLVNPEDLFGSVSIEGMDDLLSLLVKALINKTTDEGVARLVDLSPAESAILESKMWDLPSLTSWGDLISDLFGFELQIGIGWTVGGIVFCYQWEHDTDLSFGLIPILIFEIYGPTISIPVLVRPGEPGGPGAPSGSVIPIDSGYVIIPPPSVTYPTPPTVRVVPPRILSPVNETVRLYISQQATLERDAFLATLTMKNKLGETPLENVSVDLQITYQNDTNAADNFFICPPNLENINAIDGTGTISPTSTARSQWTIIPKPGAGGESKTGIFYLVQAFITYTVNGIQFSVSTTKEVINVKPQPLLNLTYYIPSEVKGNVPFKLAVKVTNVGYGTAHNFEIETAQPVVYDNISGLLIDFKIIGSAIRGEPAGNSLKINFGDIPPGASVIAYWVMVSSLDGVFLDFTASFTHTSELGGAETSLILTPIRTHILMRDVMIDDISFLFLIDANNDGTPDELIDPIFGEGTPIVDVDYTVLYEPGAATMIVQTQKYQGYWIWVEVDDPYNNQVPIQQIIRSDGEILNPMNYWMANGKIYFVDDPEESYTIVYELVDADAPLTSASLNPETPNGQNNWYTVQVNVTLTANDEISGVAATYYRINDGPTQIYTVPFAISDDGIYTTQFWSIDNAGNNETAKEIGFKIDKTPPTIEGAPTTLANAYGWYNADVTIHFEASDFPSGLSTVTPDHTLSDEGADQSVTGTATDNAGNSASYTVTSINIDKTPPTITGAPTTPANVYGWYKTDVVVHFLADDSLSGLDTVTPDQTLSSEGAGQSVTGTAFDKAGNAASFTVTDINIDKTKPTSSLTLGDPKFGADPTYVSTTTEFKLEAVDSLSGLDYIEYNVDSGSWSIYAAPFNVLDFGSHTVYYRSIDLAGNVEDTQSVWVVVNATSLTYSGDTTGQYSDPVTVEATLIDMATQQPISCKTITFTIGTQSVTSRTDSNGIATTSIVLDQPAGAYTVSATFVGKEDYLEDSDSQTFTIQKEDATVDYTGDTVVPKTTRTINLRATSFDNPDGWWGDLTKMQLTFRIYTAPIDLNNPVAVVGPVSVTKTDVSGVGVAKVEIPNLSENGYIIIISIDADDNDYYHGPTSDPIPLTVYEPTGEFVTGGGWIRDPTGSKGNFGFNVKYTRSGKPRGHSVYVYRDNEWNYIVKSNAWIGLAIEEGHAYFEAKCVVQKYNPATQELVWAEGNYKFRVDVWDNDSDGGVDIYQIRVLDKNGVLYHEAGFDPLGELQGGNIVIHNKRNKKP